MSRLDVLAHLTRPVIEKLPVFQQQPPTNDTRYVVKCNSELCVEGTGPDAVTKTWFKTPPLQAQTIRMISGVKLFADSHDQGPIKELVPGNWTWFQLAIFACETDTEPKKDSQGQEMVMTSHSNKVNSCEYEWLEGAAVTMRRIFLKGLEPGNVVGVRLCARFQGWKIFAKNGYLVLDIGEDNQPYAITPIKINVNLTMPVRRNVQTWYNEAKTNPKTGLEVSLFIRCLKTFQQLPPENQLSYYRIAGIHGYPYQVPWSMGKPVIAIDNPNLKTLQAEGHGGWYCQHNNDLFPTWHRVYMMLYEKRIQEIMMDEAETRDQGTGEWTAAATRWRLPYWDWAADSDLPEIASTKTIRVIKSWDGHGAPVTEELDNSMYRFQMPGQKAMGSEDFGNYRISNKETPPWQECVGTSRHAIYPDKKDDKQLWRMGETNLAEVNKALKNARPLNNTLRDSVFRLLTENYSTKYVRFASTKYDKAAVGKEAAREFLSLEQIHNSIHSAVGGRNDNDAYGHMASVAVAAFDPVFWLHHCNIDRLLNLWQCSNPGNWFHQRPGQAPAPIPRPDHDTEKEPVPPPVDLSPQDGLRPFHVSEDIGNFWNSNQVRNVEALNYTYDYIDKITDDFGDIIPERSNKYINELYGPPLKAFGTADKQIDPVVNVIYDRYAFEGRPYSLLFFLGEIDPKIPYKQQTSLIGSVFTFTSVMRGNDVTCRSCYIQRKANVLSRAQVPLTTVVPAGQRPDRTACRYFLQDNLRWTAVFEDGSPADRDGLKDLRLTLAVGRNQLISVDAGAVLSSLLQLDPEKMIKSRFKFDSYVDQPEFDWDKAYIRF